MNNTPPGQQAYGLVVDIGETLYGSEGRTVGYRADGVPQTGSLGQPPGRLVGGSEVVAGAQGVGDDIVPTMNTEVVITVTWMDGKIEVYHNASHHKAENGVLTIDQSRGSSQLPLPYQKTLHLPLANIREFAVEERLKF